jgi:hypothetical protein
MIPMDWYSAHNFENNKLVVYRTLLRQARRNKTLDLRINQRVAELQRLNGFKVRFFYF